MRKLSGYGRRSYVWARWVLVRHIGGFLDRRLGGERSGCGEAGAAARRCRCCTLR
jgi:hypothetical protein